MYHIIKKYFPSIQYIRFCMKNAALSVIAAMLLKTGIALLPTLQALALGRFIDEVTDSFTVGIVTAQLMESLAVLCSLLIFTYLLDSLYSLALVKLKIRVGVAYDLHLLKKHSALAVAALENSKTCQLIEQVTEESTDKMYKGFQNLMDMAELQKNAARKTTRHIEIHQSSFAGHAIFGMCSEAGTMPTRKLLFSIQAG